MAKVAINRYAHIDVELVDGELRPGLRSIAVPIRTPESKTMAAVKVGQYVSTVTVEDMQQ